jgi:hypothetical protein
MIKELRKRLRPMGNISTVGVAEIVYRSRQRSTAVGERES